MSDQLSRDEFLVHVEVLRDQMAEVIKLQRDQNGRVWSIDSRVAVLEDRSPGRVGVISGGIVAGVIGAGAVLVKLWSMMSQP